jgi:acetyl-CoA carboxylase carboxyltransferase component
MSRTPEELEELRKKVALERAPRHQKKLAEEGKLFVRERIRLLLDPDTFVEDGIFANALAPDLPADGVVTGIGTIHGRHVCVMANDPTVKAGSWGARTVEKILRIQEKARSLLVPMIYLVDSAGARITDQVAMFPGRRGAGRIFYNEVQLSGLVPQICGLFGPSAAGGAYIPAFCDVVMMMEGNGSMYLGSPRMAEMVIGEKVTLEEMGGARMHATVSGSGDLLFQKEEDLIQAIREYLRYFPQNYTEYPPDAPPSPPDPSAKPLQDLIPPNQNQPFDMYELIRAIVDEGSFFELKPLWARELITGFARIEGMVVGIVANQPRVKGGVLFVDSADKGARFIWLCSAFNIPLVFLADVPGFMIGTQVERQGIIRHGAKMIYAVSEATVPRISVIIRKAYGAGLYAMSGPGFEPDCTLALPYAMIAVMGPEAAVNAVYYNKIQELSPGEREAFIERERARYAEDIDIVRLAGELVVDEIVFPDRLREELAHRLRLYRHRPRTKSPRWNGVPPV